jgi:hypothetical protein
MISIQFTLRTNINVSLNLHPTGVGIYILHMVYAKHIIQTEEDKILTEQHSVENKTGIMHHVIKMQ